MSRTGEIPYTWPQIEEQIKEAILAQASILETFGPWCDGRLVADYLGISEEEFRAVSVEDVTQLDIQRHQLFQHVKIAYDYAYQLEGRQEAPVEYWHDADGLLQGFPETDAQGEPSPFCRLNDFPLRRLLETFFARFALFESEVPLLDEYKPSIRELSLMANMTVPAVRTSLSKEGFKLEKSQVTTRANQEEAGFRLNATDARLWLSRRRGFIPQRIDTDAERVQQTVDQILTDRDLAFPLALARIMELRDYDASRLALQAALDQDWLSALLSGQSVRPDLAGLRLIARILDVPEPDFVASGIRHTLAGETGSSSPGR